MNIVPFKDKKPEVAQSVYVAPNATIVGDVLIGENSSVWFNCVVRGDESRIIIGEATNIQDFCMLHADSGNPLAIGNRVTVGHTCVLHGCIIEDDCLIGMGSILMNGARIGRGSVIAAGTVVPENRNIPSCSLVAGTPGKVIRTYEESRLDENRKAARHYVERAGNYRDSAEV